MARTLDDMSGTLTPAQRCTVDTRSRELIAEELARSPDNVVLAEKLAKFSTHFDPKIVGELNGQHVKLVKFQGEFVWHRHEQEDEMFLVIAGALEMQFRDRSERVGEGGSRRHLQTFFCQVYFGTDFRDRQVPIFVDSGVCPETYPVSEKQSYSGRPSITAFFNSSNNSYSG